jgi:hypothetical protein
MIRLGRKANYGTGLDRESCRAELRDDFPKSNLSAEFNLEFPLGFPGIAGRENSLSEQQKTPHFIGAFFHFLTYGSSAIKRARLMACANLRWCFAQMLVCFGSMIFA